MFDRRRPGTGTLLHIAVLSVTLLAGFSLFWPSLDQGVFADDYVALAMMDGKFAAPRGPLDLFNFASGDPDDVAALKRLGSLPWWAPPDFRVSFMRPLSSALWHVDRALFGGWYPGYHGHSLLAWALLASAAALLYRALLPASIALLALPIFALDHSLHFPTVWLSNRGGLYATAIGALALVCHVRAREQRKQGFLALSALLWAVALAFGEWAFPMLAYIVAYELFDHGSALGADAQRDSMRMRLLALAPATALGLAFVVLRSKLGYGATGSGAYVDPADETGLFIGALFERVPVFIGDMMFNVSAAWWDHGSPWRHTFLDLELISPELWARIPYWRFFHTAIGLCACALVALLYVLVVRKQAARERKRLTFLLIGGLMSLVPVVGSFPSTRLTMAAFIGVAPLIAVTLRSLLIRAYRMCTRAVVHASFAYAAACGIIALHGVAPLTERIGLMVDGHRTTAQWVGRAPLDPERVREQHVYLLASTEFTTTFFFAYIWAAQGKPVPKSVQPLVAAPYAFDVERTGPSTLIVQTLGGGLLTSSQEYMFRSRLVPTRAGDRFELDGVRVTVLREYAGEAQAIALDFDLPLDDPSQVVLVAKREGFERWLPPPIGGLARVPRAPGPSWPGLERALSIATIGVPPEAVAYVPTPAAIRFDPDHP